jgi:glutathione S-transferase
MSLPILYSFRRCPYAMRARMALAYAGIRCELREVDLKNKPAPMLQVSPKGTVPIFQCDDGTVIDESLDVMVWALTQHDPDNWMDSTDDLFMGRVLTEFKDMLNRYKYPDRFPGEAIEVEAMRRACESFMRETNDRLTKGFLMGPRVGFVDVAVFPFFRQCRMVDEVWFDALDFQHLKTWVDFFSHSNMFQQAMKKETIWQVGTTGPEFPALIQT